MEVDRPVTDAAAAEVGNEGLAETVQQRTAEEDRDAGCSRVRVDLFHVRRFDTRGVEVHRARLVAVGDAHAVHLEQRTHDRDVADRGDVAQHARRLAEERRDHRLRREILGARDLDAAGERAPAANTEHLSCRHPVSRLAVCSIVEK